MNADHADLLIRCAHAMAADGHANDEAQAADEGHGTPEAAAQACWDAASKLRTLGEKLIDLSERNVFAARRYERAHQEERRTGVEYRAGDAA